MLYFADLKPFPRNIIIIKQLILKTSEHIKWYVLYIHMEQFILPI